MYTTQNAHGVHFDCKFIVCDAANRSERRFSFSKENVRHSNPCLFAGETRLGFNVIVNLYVNSSRMPCLFGAETRLAGILPHSSGSLSLCFSQVNCVLGSHVTVSKFICDAANPSQTPNIFPRKTRLAGGGSSGSLPLQIFTHRKKAKC